MQLVAVLPDAGHAFRDRAIRANFGRMPSAELGRRLGLTGRQVAGRARALGLCPNVVWTPREDRLLTTHYRAANGRPDSAAIDAICAITGKRRHQVTQRARALGQARVKERPWSKDDLARLSILWGRQPDAKVARTLGRTVAACKVMATRRLRRSRHDGVQGWSLRACARLCGVDDHKVATWIEWGWLRAAASPIGAGKNHVRVVPEPSLVAFLRGRPWEYDPNRINDPSGYYARIAQQAWADAALLTTAQLAARYGASVEGARRWLRAGLIPFVRAKTNGNAGVCYVRAADLARFTPPRPDLLGRTGRGKGRRAAPEASA